MSENDRTRAIWTLKYLLQDYRHAAENDLEWFWVDQVEDRIKALEFPSDARPSGPDGSQAICPHCHEGHNSRDWGGSDTCFHCDTCSYIGCMWTRAEKAAILATMESAERSTRGFTPADEGKAIGSADKDLQIQELTSSLTALRGAIIQVLTQGTLFVRCEICLCTGFVFDDDEVEHNCSVCDTSGYREVDISELSTALAVSRVPHEEKADHDSTRHSAPVSSEQGDLREHLDTKGSGQ